MSTIRQYTKLPSPEAVEGFSPKLASLIKEHKAALSAARATKGRHEALKGPELDKARRQDEEERTNALRAGKKDPGAVRTQKIEGQLKQLMEETQLRFGVVGRIERDIASLIARKRGEWLEHLKGLIAEDNAQIRNHLDEVDTFMKLRAEHRGLATWLAESKTAYTPERYSPPGGVDEQLAIRTLIGSTVEAEDEDTIVAGDVLTQH